MNGLPKPDYVMSEPHLSGYRVILGYETLTETQDAQAMLAAAPASPSVAGGGELARLIRTKFIGIEPDCQDMVLEDHDWQIIVSVLEGLSASPQPEQTGREEAPEGAGERDYPAEFEAWWSTYRHRNRDKADYSVKKQIAFDAFYFSALRAQQPEQGEAVGDGEGGYTDAEILADTVPADLLDYEAQRLAGLVGWVDQTDIDHLLEGNPLTTTLFPYETRDANKPLYTRPAPSPQPADDKLTVMKADDVPVWSDGIVTDGERVAMAQKAEADYGSTYWATDDGGDGSLEWEPTHFIALPALKAEGA